MRRLTIYLIIILFFFNCNKENDKIQKEKLHSENSCQIPYIQLLSSNEINEIFLKELLDVKEIKKINYLRNNLFHKYDECFAKRLYFNKTVPIEAGKYENSSPFYLYDLIYLNVNEAEIAFNNLKMELKSQSKNIDNIQFDYFKGTTYLFYLDKNKITISVYPPIPNIKNYDKMLSFAKKNKDKFNEIVLGSSMGMEVIK